MEHTKVYKSIDVHTYTYVLFFLALQACLDGRAEAKAITCLDARRYRFSWAARFPPLLFFFSLSPRVRSSHFFYRPFLSPRETGRCIFLVQEYSMLVFFFFVFTRFFFMPVRFLPSHLFVPLLPFFFFSSFAFVFTDNRCTSSRSLKCQSSLERDSPPSYCSVYLPIDRRRDHSHSLLLVCSCTIMTHQYSHPGNKTNSIAGLPSLKCITTFINVKWLLVLQDDCETTWNWLKNLLFTSSKFLRVFFYAYSFFVRNF